MKISSRDHMDRTFSTYRSSGGCHQLRGVGRTFKAKFLSFDQISHNCSKNKSLLNSVSGTRKTEITNTEESPSIALESHLKFQFGKCEKCWFCPLHWWLSLGCFWGWCFYLSGQCDPIATPDSCGFAWGKPDWKPTLSLYPHGSEFSPQVHSQLTIPEMRENSFHVCIPSRLVTLEPWQLAGPSELVTWKHQLWSAQFHFPLYRLVTPLYFERSWICRQCGASLDNFFQHILQNFWLSLSDWLVIFQKKSFMAFVNNPKTLQVILIVWAPVELWFFEIHKKWLLIVQ